MDAPLCSTLSTPSGPVECGAFGSVPRLRALKVPSHGAPCFSAAAACSACTAPTNLDDLICHGTLQCQNQPQRLDLSWHRYCWSWRQRTGRSGAAAAATHRWLPWRPSSEWQGGRLLCSSCMRVLEGVQEGMGGVLAANMHPGLARCPDTRGQLACMRLALLSYSTGCLCGWWAGVAPAATPLSQHGSPWCVLGTLRLQGAGAAGGLAPLRQPPAAARRHGQP